MCYIIILIYIYTQMAIFRIVQAPVRYGSALDASRQVRISCPELPRMADS